MSIPKVFLHPRIEVGVQEAIVLYMSN